MIGAARFLPLTSVDADALGGTAGAGLSLGFADDGAGAEVDAIGGGEGSTLKRDARADSEGIVVQLDRGRKRADARDVWSMCNAMASAGDGCAARSLSQDAWQ